MQEIHKTPNLLSEQRLTPKRPLKLIGNNTRLNFTSFQDFFIKKMEAVKVFIKSAEKI